MSNIINLMPEEFRDRDEKERIKARKKPQKIEVEFSEPVDDKKTDLKSDKPKKSFWTMLFGEKNKVIKKPDLSMMAPGRKLNDLGSSLDILKKAKDQKIQYQEKDVKSSKSSNSSSGSSFGGFLGRPNVLINDNDKNKEIEKKEKSHHSTDYDASHRELIERRKKMFNQKVKVKGMWWRSLVDFFLGTPVSVSNNKVLSDDKFESSVKSQVNKFNNNFSNSVKKIENNSTKPKRTGTGFFSGLVDFLLGGKKNTYSSSVESLSKPSSKSKNDSDLSIDMKRGMGELKIEKHEPIKEKKEKNFLLTALYDLLLGTNKKEKKLIPAYPEKIVLENKTKIKQKKISKYSEAPKTEKSSPNINLVPEELVTIKHYGVAQQVFLVLFVVIFPALIVYGAYWWLEQKTITINQAIDEQLIIYQGLDSEVSGLHQEQLKQLALQEKLLTIKGLLDKQNHWTNFFGLLEQYTLNNVYYSGINGDSNGNIVLPAIASDSLSIDGQVDHYDVVAKQIAILENATELAQKIEVNNIKLNYSNMGGINGVAFKIKMLLTDDVLLNK